MRLVILYLILSHVFACTIAFAHKDRIEKPKAYRFVLQNGEIIAFNNNDSKLIDYCNDIVNRKKKLIRAELIFRTGETLTFEGDGYNGRVLRFQTAKKSL